MPDVPAWHPPAGDEISAEDVHGALAFLVAVEPDPPPPTREAYDAAIAAHADGIAAATRTLRRFAEQIRPQTLEAMQRVYYGFTNDPRYLGSGAVIATVTASLNEAWNGVGPWRR